MTIHTRETIRQRIAQALYQTETKLSWDAARTCASEGSAEHRLQVDECLRRADEFLPIFEAMIAPVDDSVSGEAVFERDLQQRAIGAQQALSSAAASALRFLVDLKRGVAGSFAASDRLFEHATVSYENLRARTLAGWVAR
ncbi:hypothetical protein F1C58_16245 (plasmid) [Glaciihabitans sp. INWT7]|uniref:hypothetical protein n=1 Tax=Glaciihabitans sp. INWT7 TaxID=2596912 RepID=UPI0016282616|nr:hypothetical protein [Glaciihabitans sp. INWT7]QNE48610.1 hypothetical protein F1C58_16245 [Glaciihabitans sp. INWT7]